MNQYQNVRLNKSMYKNAGGFEAQLERADPSAAYKGTELEGMSPLERQLKRFDIRVSGPKSDRVEKFFQTADSALLFPAYMAKAVEQGQDSSAVLDSIIAAHTVIDSMDYRSISSLCGQEEQDPKAILEGGFIPQTTIALQDHLVNLKKRGRMLVSSYEAIRFQRLDLFSVALRQIGAAIAKTQLEDAVKVLMEGDGNDNPAETMTTAASGVLSYSDMTSLWSKFTDYEMNVLLASPDMANRILSLSELRQTSDGLRFAGPNEFVTPFGAKLIKSAQVPAGTVIALDKNCAIEMVSAGDITVDYDKLIDCQLERVAVTAITGFAKIFPQAVKVLTLKH